MAQVHRRSRSTSAITQGQVRLCAMGVFSNVRTGSLQGIAERPLPCSYNLDPASQRPFTAIVLQKI